MRFPRLVRRAGFWLPTSAGWLAIVVAAVAAVASIVFFLYPFLAINQPVAGRVLVVEGWMSPSQLDHAVEAYRNGSYNKVLTTGGPVVTWPGDQEYSTAAHRAARYLALRGVPPSVLVAAPAEQVPRHRTFQGALAVRARLQAEGVHPGSVDVVSAGPHARRSRFLYRLVFGPQTRVGVLAAYPDGYDPQAWWLSSAGVQEVLREVLALVWVAAFFWPEGRLPW